MLQKEYRYTVTRVAISKPKDHSITTVRAGFVAQGTSLHGWCKQSRVDTWNVRKALTGKWVGAKAQALATRVATASGVKK
jgi:hypothetical protein